MQALHQIENSSHTDYVRPAGFWIRFVANFIDGVILFVPLICLSFAMVGSIFFLGDDLTPERIAGHFLANMLFTLLATILQAVYFIFTEASGMQASLGKRMMGLKVTDQEGGRITKGTAAIRYFSKIISGIFYIGYIMVGVREDKRGLHDLLANTHVYHRD